MRTIDLRATHLTPTRLREVLPRAEVDATAALETVDPIIEQVRLEGASALFELAERFDKVRPQSLRVPKTVITEAEKTLSPEVRAGLEEAIRRARLAHAAQLPTEKITEVAPGGTVHQRWVAVNRVGLYVPGGLAVYPSSVVMNVVPAQTAGVGSLAVASPPQADNNGWPHPTVLAACSLLEVEEVYAVGGAQAIGMFAHGVSTHDGSGQEVEENSCQPVDVVTGPGNIYVAAAKRAVQGLVGIDSEAGTTEILVLADDSAHPAWVAADLISQAEHDPAAASVLVTASPELVQAVLEEIQRQVAQAHHSQRITTALGGPQSGIVIVDDMRAGVNVVNAYAPEHLEIQTADAHEVASQVTNAGAVFIGPYSPVPLGDYVSGSNHVLPTGGTARFASGLGVGAYLKSMQVVEYNAAALNDVADHLVALAQAEDLPAHGTAATLRTQGGEDG